MSRPDSADADRVLDVREIDGEPFGPIVDALDALGPDETLLLINSFEPRPLYGVLERRGYTHVTTEAAAGEYHVEIERA